MNQNPAGAARTQQLLTQFWDAPDSDADPQIVGELLEALRGWIGMEIGKQSGTRCASKTSRPHPEEGRWAKTRDEWLAEDASALALHQLWEALRKMKAGHLTPVANTDALHRYAVRTARHAWYEMLRQESRQWNSVRKSIVAWVQGVGSDCAIWRLSPLHGEKLVGRCEQKGQAAAGWDGAGLCKLAEASAAALFPGKPLRELTRAEVCRAVLAAVCEPVPLNELTAAVCAVQGWSESVQRLDENRIGDAVPAMVEDAKAKGPMERLLETENVHLVWGALRQLPINQRRILMLSDLDVIETLEVYGGVSLAVIAETLELSPEQLLKLIDRMPLGDRALAALAGIKLQSVRNLRFAAKKALRRLLF